jgi:very-short-patch-repair endonuclease
LDVTRLLNQITIYLDDDHLQRAMAIGRELSRRAGIKVSRSAAIGRAIDDLFLSICPTNQTIVEQDGHTVSTSLPSATPSTEGQDDQVTPQ